MKKEAIRVVAMIPAAPTTLYYAWLSSEQHGAMTGEKEAKIDPTVGASFSALGGNVTGKLVILDLGRRLVMAWRSADFPRDAHDSRVEMHLEALGGSTRITLIQTEIPEGLGEKVRSIWNDSYFGPMRVFFSKFLPDPRNPPPPRRPIPPPDEDEEEEEAPPAKSAKGKPASSKPSKVAKPVKPEPKPEPKPAKAEKKPAKPEKKPAKPAKPEPKPAKKPAKPEPKPAKKAPPPKAKAKAAPAKKKAGAPAKAKKPEKKPAKKAEKAKPKKKK